jgi:Ceramidase
MPSGWTDPIDAYCERTDASFWSEPVNAVTNAAFLIAAAAAFIRWRRVGGSDGPALFLVAVIAIIGIGSFLFHTLANRWSRLADVLPIAVFIYGYLFLVMRRFLGLRPTFAFILTAAFVAFSFGFERLWTLAFGRRGVELTNYSVGYFPAALALLVVGAALLALRGRNAAARADAGRALLLAAGVFAISLAFRTIDFAVCEAVPLGTHFLWHTLNAIVLYILAAAAIRFRVAASRL